VSYQWAKLSDFEKTDVTSAIDNLPSVRNTDAVFLPDPCELLADAGCCTGFIDRQLFAQELPTAARALTLESVW
jgi:hypothetical protein